MICFQRKQSVTKQEQNSRKILTAITVAVLIWGSALALGAFLFEANLFGTKVTDPSLFKASVKAGLIFGCVGLFLGGWMVLLKSRNRRQAKESENPADDK